MSDLTEWLRARLNEDEAAAVNPHVWVDGPPDLDVPSLAIVNAHRAILDAYVETAAEYARHKADLDAGPSPHRLEFVRGIVGTTSTMTETLKRVVRIIATAYADRPGYQEAWRP